MTMEHPISGGDEAQPGGTAPVGSLSGGVVQSWHLPSWLQAGAPAWTWIGAFAVATGFLIALAWGRVAGETEVYLQLPYVVSAGFFGLASIMVGLATVSIVSVQRDTIERRREVVGQLIAILAELEETLSEPTSAGSR